MPDLGVVGVVELLELGHQDPSGQGHQRPEGVLRAFDHGHGPHRQQEGQDVGGEEKTPPERVLARASRPAETTGLLGGRRVYAPLRGTCRPHRGNPLYSNPGEVPHEIRRVVEYRSAARMSCTPDASTLKEPLCAACSVPLWRCFHSPWCPRRRPGRRARSPALSSIRGGWRARQSSIAPSPTWQAAGVRWARVDLRWYLVEPHGASVAAGRGDWSEMDAIVRAADRHGLQLLPIVGYSPAWTTDEDEHWEYPDAAPFETFFAAALRRYPQITAWELWNEPNFGVFAKPHPDPAGFVELLRSAHRVRAQVRLRRQADLREDLRPEWSSTSSSGWTRWPASAACSSSTGWACTRTARWRRTSRAPG